jgi:hypothetical protein
MPLTILFVLHPIKLVTLNAIYILQLNFCFLTQGCNVNTHLLEEAFYFQSKIFNLIIMYRMSKKECQRVLLIFINTSVLLIFINTSKMFKFSVI